jgi:phosphate:Na+ symporter
MGLFGGLALFLYGLDRLVAALKAVAGKGLRNILAGLTGNRYLGALTGALVTAVIQSSSVTTVLVVGFVSTQLMSLTQAIGVIIGANVGTTITAQIVAFKVTQYALLMIAIGFAIEFLTKRETLRHYGQILMSLGLVFFGMSLMGDAMRPLQSYQPFLGLMAEMANPLTGIAVAALFTALIQSSSATTAIIIVMAGQGFITLPAGIALVFGASIGTCVTAMLAAIGKPRDAVRAALAHVLFNVIGVLLWLGFIEQMAQWIIWLSPVAEDLSGTAKLAAEAPRQIANANTLFNLLNCLLFLPFTKQLAWLVRQFVPDKPSPVPSETRPQYLDSLLLGTPDLAFNAVHQELKHLGEKVQNMLAAGMPAVLHGDREALRRAKKMDKAIDALHGHIVHYLGEISKQNLSREETAELLHLLETANSLENIGDLIETDLINLGKQRLKQEVHISPHTRQMLERIQREVTQLLVMAVEAVTENDAEKALQVIGMKGAVNRLLTEASVHEAQRLIADAPDRVRTYGLEIDILEKLRRIYYFTKRIAKAVLVDDRG